MGRWLKQVAVVVVGLGIMAGESAAGPAEWTTVLPKASLKAAYTSALTTLTGKGGISTAPGSGLLKYNGGPVMSSTVNVYFIWYGTWSANTATTILPDLAANIGISPYYRINTTYTDATGGQVGPWVNYRQSTFDSYSKGAALTGTNDIYQIVKTAIDNKSLPLDATGVYFVFTSSDVTQAEFCTVDCGWHTSGKISDVDVKFAWVGDPTTQCPTAAWDKSGKLIHGACMVASNIAKSPNGNPGADSMADFFAHELEETVTDPDLNAWVDTGIVENGDRCAWQFGDTYTLTNGSVANVRIGARDYMIQTNLVNDAGGYCAMEYSNLFEGGVDRPGMDYKSFDLPSPRPELCQRACTNDTACKAFVYGGPGVSGPNPHCWLKNGVPAAVANASCLSGVKDIMETGVNRTGLDYKSVVLSAARPELCLAECARDFLCSAFTYVPPGVQGPSAKCWLKAGKPTVGQVYTGMVSGVKGREEWNTNRGGSDIKGYFLSTADPIICQADCYFDSTCRGYTYIAPGIQGASAACWLKSGTPVPNSDTNAVSAVRGGLEVGMNRPGGDYKSFKLASANPVLCQTACDTEFACRAYTYVPPSPTAPSAMCWLKSSIPVAVPAAGMTSGIQGLSFF